MIGMELITPTTVFFSFDTFWMAREMLYSRAVSSLGFRKGRTSFCFAHWMARPR